MPAMTDKIRDQIMAIRDSGATNMMDVARVQRLAFEQNFHELVIFLEENRGEYIRFILFGDAG
jgi:hypothetical protein